MSVRSTSASFSTWLARALGELRCSAERDLDPRFSVVVGTRRLVRGREVRGLHILYRGVAAIVRTRDLGTLAQALLVELSTVPLPKRGDAIYLAGSVLTAGGRAALVPSSLVPRLARLRGQANRAGLLLPGTTRVALDRSDGRLLPIDPIVPLTVVDELDGQETDRDRRAFVEAPMPVGAVLTLGAGDGSGMASIPRGGALYSWASRVLNLPVVGGEAIETLGELFAGVSTLRIGWDEPADWFGPLAGLLNGRRPATRSAVAEIRA